MIAGNLGHYEVLSELGRGGMGEVYRARDTKLGREVAIKVLPAEFARDEERLARLEREARMLAALNHPNIAAIYGLEQSDDTRFLVLELVEGDTLADRLKRGAIPVEASLKLALQIAEALEAAHEKSVIHRDLKPANIKITPEGRVKVLDFGLAKAFIGDHADVNLSNSPTLSMQATRQGVILGTAAYMSPEQTRGREVDKRTDIWAFGCVLYEMLTGRQAFSGEDVTEILASVIKTSADLTLLPANTHPGLAKVIARCLEKDVRARYRDIGDVANELAQILEDPGGTAVAAAAEAPEVPTASKLPWVAAIVVAALVAGGGMLALQPGADPGPVVRFPVVLPEDQNFTRPEVSMLAISPDGTKMAYVAANQIYVRNFNETEARPVDGTDPGGLGVAQPVFSPDGEWLAFLEVLSGTQSVLRRVPVAGGTPVTLYDEGFQADVSWPTANSIVFRSVDGIVRIPATGGVAEMLVGANEGETLGSPQVLPGGDAVLFSRVEAPVGPGVFAGDVQIAIQTIGEDDRTIVWDGGADPRYLPTGHLVYAQGNTLFAIPFDSGSGTISGGPVPLVEGVRRTSNFAVDTANYAVSDTGTLVTIPGSATTVPETTLMLVDRSGQRRSLDVPPAVYRSPRVSPDGRQLAVEIIDAAGQGHIWIYELSGQSAIRRLTQTGNNTRPIWSPDSQRVTFGSERDGSWGIFERPADGSTVAERLTTAEEGHRHFPDSWSPDGGTLAYTDADLGVNDWDVWTLDRASGMTELFAGGEINQFSAMFSPDGRWLTYTSTTPVFGIFAQPFPPTGAVFQITDQSEAAPVWTADGRELFFRPGQTTGENMQIMGVQVSTAGGITFSNRRALPIEGAVMNNGYRDFDIMPDGQQFVMVYPVDAAATGAPPLNRIDVVLNWFNELKERVPVP